MKILSNKKYSELMEVIGHQAAVIKQQNMKINKLNNDIRLYRKCLINNTNSHADIIFPNTDERGLTGEAETPINFSDIIEL